MKLLLRILLIAALTYLLSFYTPWWTVAVVAAVVCFFLYGSGTSTFVAGFLGGGGCWMGYAWILQDNMESSLADKVAALFMVGDPLYLVIASGLIGALTGGLGAVTGNSFRLLFIKKKKKSLYSS